MAGKDGGSWWNPIDNVASLGQKAFNSFTGMASGAAATQQPRSSVGQTVFANQALGNSSSSQSQPANPVANSAPARNDSLTGNNNFNGAYGTTGGGSSYSKDDLAYLDNTVGQLQRMLDSTKLALANGLTGLEDSYNAEASKANQQRSRALEDYGVQRDQMTRNKSMAVEKVNSNARNLNDSVRRILGQASGSGSSAYQLAAPTAVARQATKQRSGVMNDFAENDMMLSTAENRATADFQSLLDDLINQKRQKESELRAGVLEREAGIQQQLGNIAGERAKLLGGGYGAIRLAQQPFQDAVNTRQQQIDQLFNQFRNPVLSAKPVEVQKPELRNYAVDRATIGQNQSASTPQYSPYSTFLQKRKDETVA